VLWGEIRRFLDEANETLPILVNHCYLRKYVSGKIDPLSYVIGRVSSQEGEGMAGHHIAATGDKVPRTMFLADEASGVYDKAFEKAEKWAESKLIIGNPNPCTNYFFRSIKKGDIKDPLNKGKFFTKIIRIAVTDSPNVRYALEQKKKGKPITNEIIIPGVQPYISYLKALETWDKIQQSIGLWGEFYEGPEAYLYPQEWLENSKKLARNLNGTKRSARCMGVDTAEGGDDTCWSIVDRPGLIYLLAMKTPDTDIIPGQTIVLMREFNIKPENVVFDHGGGGKQHVDRLRAQGFEVRSVSFGGAPRDINRFKKMKTKKDKIGGEEEKDVYKNRRAEMYGILRLLVNPKNKGFAIPEEYTELLRQMKMFPLRYDEEGRMYLPPKRNSDPKSKKETIIEMIGCSPDETDSLVLATYGMMVKPTKKFAGVI